MPDEDDRRTRGVELGQLAEELEEISYPIDNDALVEEHGDRELDLEGGEATLGEVLGPSGELTYESRAEVEQQILAMVGEDAVGRKGYSDRGGKAPGIDDGDGPM